MLDVTTSKATTPFSHPALRVGTVLLERKLARLFKNYLICQFIMLMVMILIVVWWLLATVSTPTLTLVATLPPLTSLLLLLVPRPALLLEELLP